MVMVIGDTVPLDIEARSVGGTPVPIRREKLRGAPGLGVPPDFWLESESPWSMPRELVRITIDALPTRAQVIELTLGRRAPRVLARLTGYSNDVRAQACAARIGMADAFVNRPDLVISPSQSEYFATGWYAEERASADAVSVRWMGEHGAMLVPSARDGAVRIRLRASPPLAESRDNAPLLSVRVNDVFDMITVPMVAGVADYEWSIPDAAWVAGTNELLFSVSRTLRVPYRGGNHMRRLGLALHQLELFLVLTAT